MFEWFPWPKRDREIRLDSPQGELNYRVNGKIISIQSPRVVIERDAFEQLKSYIFSVDTEISGLGIIKKEGDVFYI